MTMPRRRVLAVEAIEAERDQRAAGGERLRQQLLTLEDAAADERRQRDHLERQLAHANLQLLRTGQELTAVRQSTTWRATAPLRRAVSYARTLRVQTAVQWRRFRQRGKPVSAWPTDLSRSILTASGLFDSAWYLSTYQDVAAAGLDPLAHFLSSGAIEGRRPTPLFDTAYYLIRYPDVGTSRAQSARALRAVWRARGPLGQPGVRLRVLPAHLSRRGRVAADAARSLHPLRGSRGPTAERGVRSGLLPRDQPGRARCGTQSPRALRADRSVRGTRVPQDVGGAPGSGESAAPPRAASTATCRRRACCPGSAR